MKRFLLIFFSFILVGCSVIKTSTPLSEANIKLENIYQGRFSITYFDQYDEKRNVYGNFYWKDNDRLITLELKTPLASTLALIKSTPTEAILILPNRAPQKAIDIETLMQNILGFPLPVESMRYWLKALVNPNAMASIDKNADNRISQIKQEGWIINYLAYTGSIVKHLTLTREQSEFEKPLKVQLVINNP